jgi:hypothetical protein
MIPRESVVNILRDELEDMDKMGAEEIGLQESLSLLLAKHFNLNVQFCIPSLSSNNIKDILDVCLVCVSLGLQFKCNNNLKPGFDVQIEFSF